MAGATRRESLIAHTSRTLEACIAGRGTAGTDGGTVADPDPLS